jgi:hypothetical protein
MNDRELDQLVALTAPVGDVDVAALDLSGTDRDLCEAIMSTPPIETVGGTGSSGPDPAGDVDEITVRRQPSRPRRRLRWPVRVGVATVAAAAAVVALVVVQPFGSDAPEPLGGGDDTAFAAGLVDMAETLPRILITADGWEIASADEFGTEYGTLTFDGPGDAGFELTWTNLTIPRDPDAAGPAEPRLETFEEIVAGYENAGDVRLGDLTVAGSQATAFAIGGPEGEPGSTGFYAVLWQQGDHAVVLLVGPTDETSLQTLMSSVQEVDVQTWLSAMPQSVVESANRAALVREMLADIPVPEGFDTTTLQNADGAVEDYHTIGADVTGEVVCAWATSWASARASGDTAAAQAAVEAVGSSRNWNVLREMDRRYQSDWPEVVWEIADDMAAGATTIPNGGGGEQPLEQAVTETLGCDDGAPAQAAG